MCSSTETSPLHPRDSIPFFPHAGDKQAATCENPFHYISPPPASDVTLSLSSGDCAEQGITKTMPNTLSGTIRFESNAMGSKQAEDSVRSSFPESMHTPSSPSPLSVAFLTPERFHNNPFSPTDYGSTQRGFSATGFGVGSHGSIHGISSFSTKMTPKTLFPATPPGAVPIIPPIPSPIHLPPQRSQQYAENGCVASTPNVLKGENSTFSVDVQMQTSGLSLDSSNSTEKTLEMIVDETEMPSALQTTRFCQEFEDLGLLGKGSYGDVHKVKHNINQQIYAIKTCRRKISGHKDKENKLQEVFVLAICKRCPNVVRYYDSWLEYTDSGQLLSYRIEYCDGGSVWDAWRNGSWPLGKHAQSGKDWPAGLLEVELLELMYQIARALQFLHSHRIAHMDVKPANIYMCSSKLYNSRKVIYKLGDFGLARRLDDINLSYAGRNSDEGDNRYLDENLLTMNIPLDTRTIAASDIFSFGACIYELTGRQPLPSRGNEWHRIRAGELVGLGRFSPNFKDLLLKMLCGDPRQRPEAFEILHHPVFQKNKQATDLPYFDQLHSSSESGGGGDSRCGSEIDCSGVLPTLPPHRQPCLNDMLAVYEDEEEAVEKRIQQSQDKHHLQKLGILPDGNPFEEVLFF